MPNTIWVVVADSSRARVFKTDNALGAPLQELESLAHPAARLRGQELSSDEPGRAFDRAGQGRHAMEQNVDVRENEALKFARQIADYLEAAESEHKFSKLALVAPPKFLGHLRQNLSARLAGRITTEIDKNLVQQTPDDIRRHLPERL